MTVKKTYNVGDTVWVYGISKDDNKSTQGTVIKSVIIDHPGINNTPHYVIGITTEIEMLLEIRTWHSISQTKDGHVGSIREALSNPDSARKWLGKIGVSIESSDEFTGDGHDGMGSTLDDFYTDDDISSDQIHAALEKSKQDTEHLPLVIDKPKRRHYPRKKKI